MPRYMGSGGSPQPPGPAPVTSYTNAMGTGDRSASMLVTTDSSLTPVINFVDGSLTQSAAGSVLTTGITVNDGEYVRFAFASKKYITEFKSISGATYPTADYGTWDIEASEDDVTWVSQQTGWSLLHSATISTKSVTPTQTPGFRYWRIVKDGTLALPGTWWSEFEFDLADGAVGGPGIFSLASYVRPDLGYITATGGTITTDGDYKVHSFTTGANLEITSGLGDVEYLIVGGGGGGGAGGSWSGGGGGAGAMNTGTVSRGVGTYAAVVGAGGSGGTTAADGSNGSSSSFMGVTSIGGGGGAGGDNDASAGLNGGSGGGAGGESGTVGVGGTGTDGNDGGDGSATASNYGAGGGGGDTAAGADGTGSTGGAGGAGTSNSISGSAVDYAGGGGGASFNGGTGGAGGTGGGGAGAGGGTGQAGTAGTANTGGGGGGGNWSNGAGGAGGSGIVVARYKFQ